MAFMEWTDEISVGVAALDQDHRQIVSLINELHEAIVAGHKKDVLSSVLDRLVEYTGFHFAREEKFFAESGYPAADAHKAEHEGFVCRVADLQRRFKSAPVALLDLELMSFLRNWVVTHIQGSDKKYGPCLNAHGIY